MNKYNTKQRALIINYLKASSGSTLTADKIAFDLSGSVGQTTVYRNLELLVQQKVLMKFDVPDGKSAFYKYISESESQNCCRLLCTQCGEMTDMSCGFVNQLRSHIEQDHDFTLDNIKTVFYGQCHICRAGV